MHLPPLRPPVKRDWVAALRSGDYTQGVEHLHYRLSIDGIDRYCSIGVLYDLAVKAGAIPPPYRSESSSEYVTYWKYGPAISLPSVALANWAYVDGAGDYDERWVVLNENDDRRTEALVDLNDTLHLTFAQIADRIEASL